ncbi:TRAP transporter small permease [Sagittula sp. SSi028]|uniref:TRAP transporter small permease n=1 Tax=Sagittula sp. SSi028 TaxID=3400636 RepID=UPI003AF66577
MAFWRVYDQLERAIALLALAGVVLAVLASGIGRSIGQPLMAAPQYAQLCLIWAVMLGADIATRSGEHIRVTVLVDLLPARARAALAVFSMLLMLPFLGFIVWHGWHLAMNNWQRELGASGLSYGLVTLALPVGSALLIVSFARRIWSSGLVRLFEPDADETGHTHAEELL